MCRRRGIPARRRPEGLRGSGGQGFAAEIWGISSAEYTERADPWPLNPRGELLLGLKIEDRHALEHAEESAAVRGIGFTEWGPGDMSLSFGVSRAGAGMPPVLTQARARVLAATKRAGIAFLNSVTPDNVEQMIDEGVKIGAANGPEAAQRGAATRSGRCRGEADGGSFPPTPC